MTEPKNNNHPVPTITRCEWCAGTAIEQSYHDREWGVPLYDDRRLFEHLLLDGAQAGLSWLTILKKRENYREAFDDFDPELIARYEKTRIQQLLGNPGIVRNRLKIRSAVNNAGSFLQIQEQHGSFSDWLWNFTDGRPVVNSPGSIQEIPTTSKLSDRISRELKKHGFNFVGSTIIYAFLQAVGVVNDHTVNCFRRNEIIDSYTDNQAK